MVSVLRPCRRALASLPGRRPRLAPGVDALDIDRLVSPLRYDVLVREQYLRFLARNLDLYHDDFDAFAALAHDEPYHAWFRAVAIHRICPGTEGEADLEAEFRARLHKTTRLYEGFCERGFDARYPIILRTAGPLAQTGTGKSVAGRLFPSDGCHRLALLRLTGHRLLPPDWYRVKTERGWQPPDNTGTLITALGLTGPEYFEFLSLGYADAAYRDAGSLLTNLSVPGEADELRRIIAVDAPLLRRGAPRS